jgi:hypothetical protein
MFNFPIVGIEGVAQVAWLSRQEQTSLPPKEKKFLLQMFN